MKRLIIRADASIEMGSGHLMRCLALAQAWQDAGGKVTFVTACQNDGLLQRLREEGFDIHLLTQPFPDLGDWERMAEILAAHPNTPVVLDGYHFDEAYQQRLREAGHQLLVIDDMAHLKHYYADIVLNQNLHAEQLHYSCEPYTRLLLGTRYVLFRREFLARRGWQREVPELARHVLVTLGGGDPENHTLKVIQAVQKTDAPVLEATVLIGASNPHADVLEAAIKESRVSIRLIRDARNVPALMAQADVAISSAGTTVWELAFMGIPTIVAVTTPIESFLVKGLDKYGLFYNAGWLRRLSMARLAGLLSRLVKDTGARRDMASLGQRLVDGAGCDKVLKYLTNGGRLIES